MVQVDAKIQRDCWNLFIMEAPMLGSDGLTRLVKPDKALLLKAQGGRLSMRSARTFNEMAEFTQHGIAGVVVCYCQESIRIIFYL